MNSSNQPDSVIEKDLPLREDIRLLGRLLGETLREQEGEEAFNRIEHIRQTAVRFRRDGDLQARVQLEATLRNLSHDATVSVVRAFTYFSQLSNLAEDLHHNRRRRAYQLAGSPPQEGSLALAFQRRRFDLSRTDRPPYGNAAQEYSRLPAGDCSAPREEGPAPADSRGTSAERRRAAARYSDSLADAHRAGTEAHRTG